VPWRIPALGFSLRCFLENRDETTQQRLLGPATIITMALTICWASGLPSRQVQGNRRARLYVHRDPRWRCTCPWHAPSRVRSICGGEHARSPWDRSRTAPWNEPRLHYPHAHHRSIWGRPAWGCVGVGRATHVDGDPRRLASGTWTSSGQRRRRHWRARSAVFAIMRAINCRSTTSRAVGGTRCTRRDVARPNVNSRSTAACSGRCYSARRLLTRYAWLLRAPTASR